MRYRASLPMLALAAVSLFAASAPSDRNVILVMFDGVRFEEFFNGPDPRLAGDDHQPTFPIFWKDLAPQGIVLGRPKSGREMLVGNPYYLSLPGYQSIFAGRRQACPNNDCGRIQVETFAERLVRELKLPREEVAAISSWDHIPLAVEHTPGTIFTNSGLSAFSDGPPDTELTALNGALVKEVPPWEEARFDRFTYPLAIRYLKKHHPRFLFLSLNDTDEWAHLNRYPDYLKALRQDDGWLQDLSGQLAGMGDYGKKTCLIVTTDHGRGTGRSWTTHGALTFHAENVWLYTNCLASAALDPHKEYSHLDIRPTIETVFGLTPVSGKGYGTSLIKPQAAIAKAK